MEKVKKDTLLVSLSFESGEETGVLVVGRKTKGQAVEVVNAFMGPEAREIYERLVTKKGS